MERLNKDKEIVRLTRLLLKLKTEKKDYTGEINETIKDIEGQIKALCKEEV